MSASRPNPPIELLVEKLQPHLPPALLEEVRARVVRSELRVQLLEERLRLRRLAKYGPGAEKLTAAQLELLEGEPGVSRDEVEAESGRQPFESPAVDTEPHGQRQKQNKKPHPGRQALPAELPRVERVVGCTPEQSTCADCGGATQVLGYDESERLEVKPAEYFVLRTRREKRACPRCAERGVEAAPLAPAIIEKGLAGDGVVVDTLVEKYVYHMPLYRQSVKLASEAGVELSRATLDGWVMQVGGGLIPVAAEMRRELLGDSYLQVDETPVAVQDGEGRGRHHRGYLWQYGRPGAGVVFDFRMGRERAGPRSWLGDWNGVLQTDGYAAYDGVGGPHIVHAGCWSHARRKFVDIVKLNPEDRLAIAAVAAMDALFALDRQAREDGLDIVQRHTRRTEAAPALLAAVQAAVQAVLAPAVPGSVAARAAHYTLAQWPKLTRFLEHPVLELSNNLAENSMRPIAVGRKNWIHVGSPSAGPRIAAILSVVETCRRLQLPLRSYLADVLPGLPNRPVSLLVHLTPAAWKVAHSPAQSSARARRQTADG